LKNFNISIPVVKTYFGKMNADFKVAKEDLKKILKDLAKE